MFLQSRHSLLLGGYFCLGNLQDLGHRQFTHPSEHWKHRYYAGAASLKPHMNGTFISTLSVISCIISESWSKAPFLDFNDLFEQPPESFKKKKKSGAFGRLFIAQISKEVFCASSYFQEGFQEGFKTPASAQVLPSHGVNFFAKQPHICGTSFTWTTNLLNVQTAWNSYFSLILLRLGIEC